MRELFYPVQEGQVFLSLQRFLYASDLLLHVGARPAKKIEHPLALQFSGVGVEPAGRLGREEHEEHEESNHSHSRQGNVEVFVGAGVVGYGAQYVGVKDANGDEQLVAGSE